jgi:hypothetical protein
LRSQCYSEESPYGIFIVNYQDFSVVHQSIACY